MRVVKSKDKRKHEILMAAIDMCQGVPYHKITRDKIAKKCNMATGTVTEVMGNMDSLKSELIKYAIRTKNNKIILQAISDNHPAVRNMNNEQKTRVLKEIIG